MLLLKLDPIWLKLKLNSKPRLLSSLNNKLLKKPPELVLLLKLKNVEFGKLIMTPQKNPELLKEKLLNKFKLSSLRDSKACHNI